ncbi:TetR/AcrR family transcriptional regulator [Nocardia huaxiensis]|uniref:TetR/AcrR family transcriptional regulator n=1 Tax=Nocardia huaxiensis TaxID=2755382 RepID=UPI001E33CBF8|nr:TetR/AcrR family transcriptional regulator [Nocardia huaxiensis]UFS98664.1 TetR family transcriptional regulator [Nocardia huaxiensis]
MPPSALRDRKRERTRRALYQAAVELFETRGYEATTVADIAAAAEVGTRTFFNYFASKEELLFPEPDERVSAAAQAIATRRPGERPVEVLLRALRAAGDNPGDHLGDTLPARIAVVRAQVSRTVSAVSGRAAYAQQVAQQEIARHLRAAFPDELDEVGAAALVGAVVGAVSGALSVLFQQPGIEDADQLHRKIQEITSKVLAPWLTEPVSLESGSGATTEADARPALGSAPAPALGSAQLSPTGSAQVPAGSEAPGGNSGSATPVGGSGSAVPESGVAQAPTGSSPHESDRATVEQPRRPEPEPVRSMATVHRLGPEIVRRASADHRALFPERRPVERTHCTEVDPARLNSIESLIGDNPGRAPGGESSGPDDSALGGDRELGLPEDLLV